MPTKFYSATGRLTAYALACGYIERKLDGPVEVELYCEDSVYHVRGFCAETKARLFWETCRDLRQAQSFYDHGRALATAS
jgi:hypothetical protein